MVGEGGPELAVLLLLEVGDPCLQGLLQLPVGVLGRDAAEVDLNLGQQRVRVHRGEVVLNVVGGGFGQKVALDLKVVDDLLHSGW